MKLQYLTVLDIEVVDPILRAMKKSQTRSLQKRKTDDPLYSFFARDIRKDITNLHVTQ